MELESIMMMKRNWPLSIVFLTVLICLLSLSFPNAVQSQFTDQRTWGRTTSGSINNQNLSVLNFTTQAVGVPIRGIVGTGLANSGPMTLNVNSIGAIFVKRSTQIGLQDLAGGELVPGNLVEFIFNGTFYVLLGRFDYVGQIIEDRGTGAAPLGYLIEDGSCVSQTTYAALYSRLGTTYGSCSAGQFKLADSRGRAAAALDNQGTQGAANVLTSAGSGCTATALGPNCGAQSNALTSVNQMPPYTPEGGVGVTAPTGTVTVSTPTGSVAVTDPRTISVTDTRTYRINTGASVSTATNPTFASAGGIGFGYSGDASVALTGAGSIAGSFIGSAPTASFSGNALSASFSGSAPTASFSGSAPTASFSGSAPTASFSGNALSASFTGDQQGTGFNGTQVGTSAPFATLSPITLVRRLIKA